MFEFTFHISKDVTQILVILFDDRLDRSEISDRCEDGQSSFQRRERKQTVRLAKTPAHKVQSVTNKSEKLDRYIDMGVAYNLEYKNLKKLYLECVLPQKKVNWKVEKI